MSRSVRFRFGGVCVVALALCWTALPARAQETPGERFAAAVALLEQAQIAKARAAFEGLIADYDTPENRADVEYDSLLAGSRYYVGETYFLEDRFEEAATEFGAVIGAFRTYQPESLYHLGLSKHYRQDYAGAVATLGELATQYPGSPLAPQALYYQGVCYELLQDKAAAKNAYQSMIERYPEHAWTQKARKKVEE